MKAFKIIIIGIVTAFLAAGCGEEEVRDSGKISRKANVKSVEVMDLATAKSSLSFSRRGVISSSQIANVLPETPGRVVEIYVKEGDQVRKGQVLAVLGDSLSSSMVNLQYTTSQQMRELSEQGTQFGNMMSMNSIESAVLGLEMANEAYQNALNARDNLKEILDEQLDALDEQNDAAEEAYRQAADAYAKASSPEEKQAAKALRDRAKAALEQADQAVENLELNAESQLDQADFGVRAALQQYEMAQQQLSAARDAAQLQGINLSTQRVQTESAASSAALSRASLTLRAPISGRVTDIFADKGNFVGPGQMLMQLENPDDLSVKVGINSDISSLLSHGDTVRLEGDFGEVGGSIIALDEDSLEIKPMAKISQPYDKFIKVYFEPRSLQGIFVPLDSLFLKADGNYLRTVDANNQIIDKKVETGQIIGEHIEITSGLNGSERIVVSNDLFLNEGEKVKIASRLRR